MTFPAFGRDSPFYGAFESDPQGMRANFFGQIANQPGLSKNKQQWFQDQFSQVQDRYLGHLGQQVLGGGNPDASYTTDIQNYFAPGGGAAQEWGALSPREKYGAGNETRFSPPVRYNF